MGVIGLGRWIGVLCVLFFNGLSFAAGNPTRIEAFGDSLTAGFLANTNITDAPSIDEISAIYSDLANFKLRNDRSYLAAHEPREFSWVAQLAKEMFPEQNIPIQNAAVTGAKTKDLFGQIQSAGEAENTLSFLFMGHNDLCDNTDSPEGIAKSYREKLDAAVAVWESSHKNSTMNLLPLGEIHRVYETLHGFVWHQLEESTFTCEDSWRKLFPWCPSYSRKFVAGTLRSELSAKLDAMDSELENIAAGMVSTRGNVYHYLRGVQKADYAPYEFAVDCFHLSEDGQKSLGKAVFNATFSD